MTKNEGKADRIVRLILGLIAAGLGIYYRSWWGLLAIPLLVTSASGWCGLYALLGINTCPGKKK